MASRYILSIGVLVLIAGIIIYSFAPGGPLFVSGTEHATSHYLGGLIAIIIGLVGLALYKNLSRVEVGVSVLSIILGLIFILEAPGKTLYSVWTPHAVAMQATGALIVLVGLIGIAAAILVRKTTVIARA